MWKARRRSDRDTGHQPAVEPDRLAVLEQLERVLQSPSFQGSKRCQDLLNYLVTRRLEGDSAALKERVIGAEVFGRDPAYDTSADAIVRVKANEVRKRLAVYYDQAGRSDPIRIDLPTGTYVPSFTFSGEPNAAPAAPVATDGAAAGRPAAGLRRGVRTPVRVALLAFAVLALVASGALWRARRTEPAAAEDFWKPLLQAQPPVLVCVPARDRWFFARKLAERLAEAAESGGTTLALDVEPGDVARVPDGMMSVQNHRAVLLLAMALARRRVPTEFRLVSEVTADEVRRSAVVLLGAYHNPWALQLNQGLRFTFQSENEGSREVCWVNDRQQQERPRWIVPRLWPYAEQTVDYAIISRTFDPATGQVVVSLAGVNGFGTQAAAEFLSEPRYWTGFDRLAPSGWQRRNCQIVLETRVVRNVPSPPKVLAVHVW